MFEVVGAKQINYSWAIKVLRDLIFHVIIKYAKFAEMIFEVKWHGQKIAYGGMLKTVESAQRVTSA